MKLLTHVPAFLKNKYFIALASFAVIMLFLDKNDVFTSMARNKELKDLELSRTYYTNEISKLTQEREALTHDVKAIEKQARENFKMKRDNEDLFIIPEGPGGPNK